MPFPRITDRRLLFIGGKGGVGKTTTAAALGLLAAEHGRRCLVVSTDPAHSLGDAVDRAIGDQETGIVAGLWGLEIDPDAEASRHIERVTEDMSQLVAPDMRNEIKRQMDMARMSPGAQEAALLERVSNLILDGTERYDLVIFDTAPTGHTLRMLTLPEAMAAWTDGMLAHNKRSEEFGKILQHLQPSGSRADLPTPFDDPQEDPFQDMDARTRRVAEKLLERRRLFHRARHFLTDAETTAFVFVLTPEKLPIRETRKAHDALVRFDIPVAGAIVNRVLPVDADGEFLANRRVQEGRYLDQIASQFSGLPQLHIPMLASDVTGMESLSEVARHLDLGGA